ncbi:MAG: hypothetical protein K0R52_908 [Alphaproteobacteria bacterium]|jgi:carbonic anhydrase|nr:hypothetical protein [Alphaproteobacteria bacterium]
MTIKIFSNLILALYLTTGTLQEAKAAEISSSPADVKKEEDYAPYLLVSCMDFRLRHKVQKFMEKYVGNKSYDEFVIPGASLGALNGQYPYWNNTFEDVVKLAVNLHKVTHVIFLDHRDCGAYKMLTNEDYAGSREKETIAHSQQFHHIRTMMKEKFPDMHVETLIMGLDGEVETIP